jgi:alkanesulfonate monooxygenase SsuD/methylene tetrahydromethanopterin reductase-like flavin-dependent oxidoreductase (luciferase family)
MRFGLFYEHQLPRPWEDGAEERLLANALEQIELADRAGFDYVWEVEHHFLEEYSHSSAPEVFLAAVSQRTERIRLGHGIVQVPPPYNHPARVAERIATLDLISGGRVELGTGESSSQAELGGFGVDRETKREQWDEALDAITRMLVEEPFAGYEGDYVSMPPRNVIPKPKQRPHPPLWVACSRRETILLAARKGLGALSFSFIEPEDAKEWADEYYAILESDDCVPAGFEWNPNVAVALPMMLDEDEARAIEKGIDGAHFFGYSLAHYYAFGRHVPGRTDVWEEFQHNRDERGFSREIVTAGQERLGVKLLQQGLGSLRGAVGTPAQVMELVERYEKAGVDQVIFVLQAGRNSHEDICDSIELFAEHVIPRFAGEADEREARKRERLAEARERALARREPPRQPPDYEITPNGEPSPARAGAAAAAAGGNGRSERGESSLRRRVAKLGETAFAAFVRGRSDEQLERLMGSDAALRVIFIGMEQAFVPERAEGFEGAIQFDLAGRARTRHWSVRIDGTRARAAPRAVDDAVVTIRTSVPVFARMAARELPPAVALLKGDLVVEGDFGSAARLGEMFGDASPW